MSGGVLIMADTTDDTVSVCSSFTIEDSEFTSIVKSLGDAGVIE